jgi:hypothetical protein
VYSIGLAYFLWFIGGFGALGLHRFYLGKFGTGLIWLFTGGLSMIGSIYDFFTLPMQVRELNLESRYRRALDYDGPRYQSSSHIPWEQRKDSAERIILRTAKKNNGVATPAEVALEGDISLEDAKQQLEQLVSNGYAEVRVTKKGTIVYIFQDFLTDEAESRLEDI